MRTLDGGRRLTGPNFLLPEAGAAVEVVFDPGESPSRARGLWQRRVAGMCRALGWSPMWRFRRHATGASWALSAPIDQLNVAVDIAEYGVDPGPWGGWREARQEFLRRSALEANPALVALHQWASQQAVPFLWDEEVVSMGLGPASLSWPARDLPAPGEIDVGRFGAIPTVYITGTNGKTTTARLLSRIVRCAGLHVGTTTTDGWCIDEATVEGGDWTGPGAARKVMRDARVQAAVLETARGGLLRRGLALTSADCAIVTNATDDHLGEWGIDTVADMAEAKLVVARGIRPGGVLVVNAASQPCVEAVARLKLGQGDAKIAWFGLEPTTPALGAALSRGDEVAFCQSGQLIWQRGGHKVAVCPVAEVPICFGGAAQHNVENALCAVLGARAMGLGWEPIREGLRSFTSTPKDNPGRANVFALEGATVVLDFAHNPDGIRHIVGLAAAMPCKRKLMTLGQAGDRSDQAIDDLVDEALRLQADRYVLKESLHYLRGRPLGDVTAHMRLRLIDRGVPPTRVIVTMDESEALTDALAWAQPGDLLVLLIHDDFGAALGRLLAAGAQPV